MITIRKFKFQKKKKIQTFIQLWAQITHFECQYILLERLLSSTIVIFLSDSEAAILNVAIWNVAIRGDAIRNVFSNI